MSSDVLVDLDERWQLWRLAALRSAGLPYHLVEGFASGAGSDAVAARQRSAIAAAALARNRAFVEAVTWQNLPLVQNWLGEYGRRARAVTPPGVPQLGRRGQREALLANLAQRYCAKNETIGFFGPVAWAELGTPEPGITESGSGGLRRRAVHVEVWAVAALLDAMAADPALADQVPLRRHPLCSVVDGVLRVPRTVTAPDQPRQHAVLAALDGPSTLRQLRARLSGTPGAEVERAVAELVERGAVLRGWPVPVDDHPERRLQQAIDGLAGSPGSADNPDSVARRAWQEAIDRVTVALDKVAAAAGDSDALAHSLELLDAAFTSATRRSPRRPKDERFHGRAIAYEDCRRDTDVGIGCDLVDRLRRPLGLLLDTALWLVAEVGYEVDRELRSRYRRLRRGGEPVVLTDLTLAASDVLSGAPGSARDRVLADFQARWAELIDLAGADGRMACEQVRPLADALFGRPAALPWRAARQFSADLMLRAGALPVPQWVLGELHLALNTLENRPFVNQADEPAWLLAATRNDFASGRVVPLYPRTAPDVTSRTYPPPAMDLPDHYTYWSYAQDDGHPHGAHTWPGTALTVDLDGGELVVRTPDGRRCADVREFYGEFLTALVVDSFVLRPRDGHRPRLLLDDLVVQRASWRLPVSDIPDHLLIADDSLLAGLDAVLARLGCPRRLFAKVAIDRKPFLVDRHAPLSLRGLARAIQRQRLADPAGALDLSEMLPTPDELWLGDAAGGRYTSEFRVVARARDIDGAPIRRAGGDR